MQRGVLVLRLGDVFAPGRRDSEPRLIQAAQRGDRGAFDALARTYAPPLRGFLSRRVGPDAAEDVLQETWLAGWAALKSYRGKARFKAWLYAIALHKCQDHQRMQKRTQAEELSEETKGLPAGEDAFAAADRACAVRAALAELPEPQREILDLYFYAELTLPEIAEMLGRNLSTVKYQFYRAHAQAAQALQEYAL
jgi:RNA polymerase sigma-70 factor (ECF subfamily)